MNSRIQAMMTRIMGINYEYTLEEMLKDGWEDTGQTYIGHPIYAQGDDRILYDLKRDEIVTRYNMNDRQKLPEHSDDTR